MSGFGSQPPDGGAVGRMAGPSATSAAMAHSGARLAFQPRIRRGAFFEAAWRHGCRQFSVYNRTYITGSFGDPVEEYWQVVKKVALWPVMGERQVEIAGPDAARFVQYLTPRDMRACEIGQCKYALITATDGGILSDPIILRLAEDRFWLSTCDFDLETWARGVSAGTGFDVSIRDAGVSVVQVQGPRSPEVLERFCGASLDWLRYYRFTRVPFMGCEVIVSRTGWSGEHGYEIYLPDPALGDALFDRLMEVGAPHGIAPGAVSQIRRIEAGILSWGADMTAKENPFEVGLGRLCALDKPIEFIGREALCRLAAAPLRRKMVGLTIPGDPLTPNETPLPLTTEGESVGRLTSLRHSPRVGANIALGIVAVAQAEPGTVLGVVTAEGEQRATVTPLPFTPKLQHRA
ncbi:MAG: glycine cleavage T C-terminal barrel domain-containing protein [Pseudomonadota bacterium]